MKIAFVVLEYHRSGGYSRYVAELATRYAREHEVHVFAHTFRGDTEAGIRFHRVPAWPANALTLLLSFRRNASRLLRGFTFDIVHDQGLCCDRPNVITAHICNAAWMASGPEQSLAARVFGTIAARLEKRQYAAARGVRVIAVSERVREDLARWYGYRDAIVIPHGVDADTFTPQNRPLWRERMRQEAGIPADASLFLFIGDLRKGAADCIRALERGWLLCVSAAPPEKYRALAESLGRGSRVVFRGSSDSIERYYAAADVFLLPTPYDAFGLVVLEAMAAGLPVIVSREAGAAGLIRHGENGFVSQDSRALQELMETALAHPETGHAARATALEHSWDRVAQDTLTVYHAAQESA